MTDEQQACEAEDVDVVEDLETPADDAEAVSGGNMPTSVEDTANISWSGGVGDA
jgi:hypothetical protein